MLRTDLLPTLGKQLSERSRSVAEAYAKKPLTCAKCTFGINIGGASIISKGAGQTIRPFCIYLYTHSETHANANISLFLPLAPFSVASTAGNETGTVSDSSRTYTEETITITDSAHRNLSNANVYFRLYGYQDVTTQAGQYFRIQDITPSGTSFQRQAPRFSDYSPPFPSSCIGADDWPILPICVSWLSPAYRFGFEIIQSCLIPSGCAPAPG